MFSIPAPNFTQVPNDLLDSWLPKLSFVETKVLFVIMRKTFGWHKQRDRISLSQLEKHTGALRQGILKATKSLQEKNLILKIVSGEKGNEQTFYELVVCENSNNSYQCVQHTPPSVFNTPTKETLTKEKISPIVPKGTPSSSLKKPKETKIEMAPEVFLTSKQIDSIAEKLNHDSAKISACYEKLSTWKIAKGKTNINDYLNILRWVIKAVEEDLQKPKPEDRAEAHKALAKKVQSKFKTNPDIIVGYNYIEFRLGKMGIPDPHLKFGDNGFEEQVENNLRKLRLSLDEG